MLPESLWWWERHADFSLGPMCSQVEGCCTLALIRVGEAIPASLQTHGQSPLPPARKNTVAGGAGDGSSRRVERRLGCYILEAFTGTCHRSPAGGDGLGSVQMGWSQWAQRGQSELLGAQRLEEDGLGGLKMGQ